MEEPSNEVIMYPWPWMIMEVLLMSPDSGSRSRSRGEVNRRRAVVIRLEVTGEMDGIVRCNIICVPL